MHRFKLREPYPCPPEETYRITTRDFEGIDRFTPNVTSVTVADHEMLPDGRERWLLLFNGDAAIPSIARPLVNPRLVRWRQVLLCDPQTLSIEWSIHPDLFAESFRCNGKTCIVSAGVGSEIIMNGEMHITPPKLTGVPTPVVRAAIEVLEPFVVRLGLFNLGRFYKAMKRRIST